MTGPTPEPTPQSTTTLDAPRVRWSRRHKITTWASVGILGTGLLLVGLDRGAETLIERVVAGKIEDCLGTPDRPEVEVTGFPLLPGLVRGRLDGMTMTAHDANAQGVRVSELHVEARGVERKGAGGTMDSLRGSGLVTYGAMSEKAPGLNVSYGGGDNIKISGGLGLLSGSATATANIVDGSLVLQPGEISTPLFGEMDLGSFPAITMQLRELPAGLDIDLQPTERGLEFTFDGTDVQMPGNPCQA